MSVKNDIKDPIFGSAKDLAVNSIFVSNSNEIEITNNILFLNTRLVSDSKIIDKFYLSSKDYNKWNEILQQILLKFSADNGFILVYDNINKNLIYDFQFGNLCFNKQDIFEYLENGKTFENSIYLKNFTQEIKALLFISRNKYSVDFCQKEKDEFFQFQVHFERAIKIISNIKFDGKILKNYINSLEQIDKLHVILTEKHETLFVSSAIRKTFLLNKDDDFLKIIDFSSILNNLKFNNKITNEINFQNNKFIIFVSPIDDFILKDNKTKLFLIELNKVDCVNISCLNNIFTKYALTKSESEIILLLLKGYDVSKISLKRNSSRETVRAQLRSLRAKTGAKSLVELIAIFKQS